MNAEVKAKASDRVDQLALDIEKGKGTDGRLQELGTLERHEDEFDDGLDYSAEGGKCCRRCKGMGLIGRIAMIIALACLIVNVLAMLWEGKTIVYVAGFIAILMATVVFVLQLQLEETGSKSQRAFLHTHTNSSL